MYFCANHSDRDALFSGTQVQRGRLLRLAAAARHAVGAADARAGARYPVARENRGDRGGAYRYGCQRLLLCGAFRLCGARARSGADGLQTEFPAAGGHCRGKHDARGRRCARPFRSARARIPLLHRAAQEPLYAGHDVAVLRAAGCRADERGGGLAAVLRRFYVVRQAQFEQQDQHLPRHARVMDGRRAGRALLYDPCRPFPAQHGAVAGRDAGRRGARALYPAAVPRDR